MALRKILFQNPTEGFYEEFKGTGTGGDGLDLANGFISNVAGPPLLGTDAANKDYVDAVASGLDLKASCRVKSVIDMPDAAVKSLLNFTGLGCPLLTTTVKAKVAGVDGNLLTVTVVGDSLPAGGVTIGEVGNATTIHYESGVSTEAQVEAAITGTSTLLDVFTAGGGVVAIGPGGWGPTYLTGGFDGWTYTPSPTFTLEASTDSSLNNVFDGVTVAVGNRVLVTRRGGTDATPDTDNGIYVVTTLGDDAGAKFKLTRAGDFNSSAEITAGAFTFVTEGTSSADKGFVLVTNDPITLDTTALQWSQFSSTTVYTFDQGLSETSGSVKVELDTAADAQGAGAGGGTSGLEFDANTAAGKLRVAVGTTGGINRASGGLIIEIDPLANTAGNQPNVATTSAGLKVLYGPKTQENYIANEAIAVKNAVAWAAGVNDKLALARADSDAKARVIGVAVTASAGVNDTIAVVSEGVAAGAINGLGFTAGDPVYLADTGSFTTFVGVGAAKRVIRVGTAKNATDLFVDIIDFGKKAA
jgi:hypothetical protein